MASSALPGGWEGYREGLGIRSAPRSYGFSLALGRDHRSKSASVKESKRIKHAKRRTRSTAWTQANCPSGGNQQRISKDNQQRRESAKMPRGGPRAGSGGKRAGAGRKPGVVRYGAPRRLRTCSGTREVISINQKESASMEHGGAQTNSGGKRPRT